jgi:predicted RNA methylase
MTISVNEISKIVYRVEALFEKYNSSDIESASILYLLISDAEIKITNAREHHRNSREEIDACWSRIKDIKTKANL